ncbi:hypothetical protein ElyMa_005400500 [Elysia marginata]|uniref:Uncharacterized protein n=1 Tax=Elysia marginata TaxID=1093978 RepID=A0AAV4EH96_9GAST|nr:hypothetical protein ElyMa_005400500 [Elysia marginata]
MAYFIEEKGRCMFITEGFKSDIPRKALDDCTAKDPYPRGSRSKNHHHHTIIIIIILIISNSSSSSSAKPIVAETPESTMTFLY